MGPYVLMGALLGKDMKQDNKFSTWQFQFESRPGMTQRAYRNYCSAMGRLSDFFGADMDVRNIFHADVCRYRDFREKHAKAATTRTDIQIGKAFYNFLAQRGVVESFFNPFNGIRYREEKEKPPADAEGSVEGQPN